MHVICTLMQIDVPTANIVTLLLSNVDRRSNCRQKVPHRMARPISDAGPVKHHHIILVPPSLKSRLCHSPEPQKDLADIQGHFLDWCKLWQSPLQLCIGGHHEEVTAFVTQGIPYVVAGPEPVMACNRNFSRDKKWVFLSPVFPVQKFLF